MVDVDQMTLLERSFVMLSSVFSVNSLPCGVRLAICLNVAIVVGCFCPAVPPSQCAGSKTQQH